MLYEDIRRERDELRRHYKVCNATREDQVCSYLVYPRGRVVSGLTKVLVTTPWGASTSPLWLEHGRQALNITASRTPDHAVTMQVESRRGAKPGFVIATD